MSKKITFCIALFIYSIFYFLQTRWSLIFIFKSDFKLASQLCNVVFVLFQKLQLIKMLSKLIANLMQITKSIVVIVQVCSY